MSGDIKDYKIIEEKTPLALTETVMKMIENGYEPFGEAVMGHWSDSMTQKKWYQTMIKRG